MEEPHSSKTAQMAMWGLVLVAPKDRTGVETQLLASDAANSMEEVSTLTAQLGFNLTTWFTISTKTKPINFQGIFST